MAVSPFQGISDEQWTELSETRRKEAFTAACLWPIGWRHSASLHLRAADIIYEVAYSANQRNIERMIAEHKSGKHQTGSRILEGDEAQDAHDQLLITEYLLLAGYALECILKGYLLLLRPELVKDGKKLDAIVLTHNLKNLCKECSVPVSQEEENLLAKITRIVDWGKYPGPIKLEQMPSPVDPGDKLNLPSVGNLLWNRRGKESVNRIFQKIFDAYIAIKTSKDAARTQLTAPHSLLEPVTSNPARKLD